MRKFTATALGLAGLIAFSGTAAAQSPREWKCTGNPDISWDEQVVGCAKAIQSGQYSGKGLSWAYNNRGNAWHATGDFDRAIADLTEAIKLDPKDARAYNNRGMAWRAKGDSNRALSDYNEAIKLDPKFAKAYTNCGVARAAKGDSDHAMVDFTEAITLDPKFGTAYFNRGVAWGTKGDSNRAIADYNEAIKLDPNWPMRTSTAALPGPPRATPSAPSQTSTRRSSSIRN